MDIDAKGEGGTVYQESRAAEKIGDIDGFGFMRRLSRKRQVSRRQKTENVG